MPSQLDWLLFIELTFSRVNRAQGGMQKVPYQDDFLRYILMMDKKLKIVFPWTIKFNLVDAINFAIRLHVPL